jgi:nickel ABC transporter permease subunit NikB
MPRYVLRRLAIVPPLWIGISLIAFLLAQLAPGDPARMQANALLGRPPTESEVAIAREQMGLDRPAAVQFVDWIRNALQGDLGASYRTGQPVRDALLERLPSTLQLSTSAMLVSLVLSLPIGLASALHRNAIFDQLARGVSLLLSSIPSYWLAYLLILFFSVRLHLLPVAGSGTWQHLVLPTVTLGLGGAAMLIRLTRSEVLEVLGMEFVRTARAKGLSERTVLIKHALRNALLPVTTIAGLQFAGLLSGTIVVETVFAWPGIGRLAVDAVSARDYPMIQAFVVLSGTLFLIVNLLVDLLYAWSDPRIRLGSSQ